MAADHVSVVLAGLPGKMACEILARAGAMEGVELLPIAFSSARRTGEVVEREGIKCELVRSDDAAARRVLDMAAAPIVLDFSTPDAALENIRFYAREGFSFLMGATGFDGDEARRVIGDSKVCAVIAPNLASPVVLAQAAAQWLGRMFPGALDDCEIEIVESHQAAKRDVSGTARALAASLQPLGRTAAIRSIRDPKEQLEIGVPAEHLAGHAWHWIRVRSRDGGVAMELSMKLCGRAIYVDGAIRSARFLRDRVASGARGMCYSMADVLAGSR